MPKTYIGNSSNVAKKCKKIYIGNSSDKAKRCKKVYVGDSNNVARLCHVDMLSTITFYGAVGDVITFTYNGEGHRVAFNSGSYYKSYDLWLNDAYIDITFTSQVSGWSTTARIFAGQAKAVNVYPESAAYWYGREFVSAETRNNTGHTGGLETITLNKFTNFLEVSVETSTGYQSYNAGGAFAFYNRSNNRLQGIIRCSSTYSGLYSESSQLLNVNTDLNWDSFWTSGLLISTDQYMRELYYPYSIESSYFYIGKGVGEGSYDQPQLRKFYISAVY